MHMRPEAKPAWDRLTFALQEVEPDCLDDERYIADLLQNGEKKILASICSACPLLTECMDYALVEKPKAGWWPGVQLKQLDRKEAA